jgi:hypothetical protein
MYSPAFQTVIADTRIKELRRARESSREDRKPRPAARWGLLGRAGIRRLVFADPSRAN